MDKQWPLQTELPAASWLIMTATHNLKDARS